MVGSDVPPDHPDRVFGADAVDGRSTIWLRLSEAWLGCARPVADEALAKGYCKQASRRWNAAESPSTV
jgi:hypothetical protein